MNDTKNFLETYNGVFSENVSKNVDISSFSCNLNALVITIASLVFNEIQLLN